MNCKNEEKEFFRDKEHEPISFKFKLIHEAFANMFNRQLREDDMTFSQLMVVSLLWERRDEKVTQKDISEALHIKHPTTIGLLKRLEEKEMVKVVVDPDNRRYRNIALTEKGEKFIQMNRERRIHNDENLVDGMTEEEIKTLRSLLDRVIDNMNKLQ
ncbi:MarR family winged helix-turn-helix transcriptional regulator [Butyrivibrio sp. VCB2006]|uniref:MarR family winged helix-turn-helix transcriptional regulator n=1 Tax=Butyrivibrio sp. VCB2006 TaxID=1280679 RepID=UPI000410A393|nr:MarR family transcriptional regulator [Butyrivibrio sp. VCB2006]